MLDLPGPGLKPVSPALAGGFLTTVPPGKSPFFFFLNWLSCFLCHSHHPHLSENHMALWAQLPTQGASGADCPQRPAPNLCAAQGPCHSGPTTTSPTSSPSFTVLLPTDLHHSLLEPPDAATQPPNMLLVRKYSSLGGCSLGKWRSRAGTPLISCLSCSKHITLLSLRFFLSVKRRYS